MGFSGEYAFLVVVIITVTTGEVIMSPPSLTLTSRMAPKTMIGRYMGIFSFFEAGGWSLGPLYGGWYLDHLADEPAFAWLLIASLALVAALGFAWFGKRLDDRLNS
jgi:MFS family permease